MLSAYLRAYEGGDSNDDQVYNDDDDDDHDVRTLIELALLCQADAIA
jgi:hypothetical protein